MAITSYMLWSIGILPAMAFIILYVYNILETNMSPKERIVSLALPTGPFGYGAFGNQGFWRVAVQDSQPVSHRVRMTPEGRVAPLLNEFFPLFRTEFGCQYFTH